MPRTEWTAENSRYTFIFFPFVGAVIGAAISALMCLCGYWGFNRVFFASMAIAANVLITGGIHFDGFCDVMDAVSSRKEREEKLRIMKDPHTGAFAVIGAALLFAVQLGIFTQLFDNGKYIGMIIFVFILSRMLTGLSVIVFPQAKNDGIAATFAKGASKKGLAAVLLSMIAVTFAVLVLLYEQAGLIMIAVSALLFFWHYFYSKVRFGGITGDIAGFFLNVYETVTLLTVVILGVNL
jgi:adenosylcobinamide-GDP ribazoletransferase